MVAKLIVWDVDRELATGRMLRALGEFEVGEITTLIPFHCALLASDQWARGETCRDLIEDEEWLQSIASTSSEAADDEDDEGTVEHDYTVEVSGRRFDVKVIGPPAAPAANGAAPAGARTPPRRERSGGRDGSGGR
jgi:acetyl-CoA/propionyl-CoA carboxylase biotin carboxyl carrier protein